MKQNIVVLFGGVSCEHDISIITALQAMHNLDKYLYNIIPVYICKDGKWLMLELFKDLEEFKCIKSKAKEVVVLPSKKSLFIKKMFGFKKCFDVDCVVNCMHGMRGEDGSISSLLDLSGIPYTSSGLLGSVVGIDKDAFKRYVKDQIPVLDYISISNKDYYADVNKCIKNVEKKIGYPLIIKPARLGSSIGIKVCKRSHDLANFIENALKYDEKVIIEPYLSNITEYNIAIYDSMDGMRISSIESPFTSDEILSFNNKYLKNKNDEACFISSKKKCVVETSVKKEIIKLAKICYGLLECKGVVRFDYILDNDTKKLYLNEVNTIPGSLANYLFSNLALDFSTQLDEQIRFAIHEKSINEKLIKYFESSVLDNVDLSNLSKMK